MVATVPFGFYQGTRSEYLATYLLSRLSIVTPVPREGDFGIDLICHLVKRCGRQLEVGVPFSVQVKTEARELCYPTKPGEEHNLEVKWLLDQSVPFLIAIVNRREQCMQLYSTWPLTKLKYEKGYAFRQITLLLGTHENGTQEPLWDEHTGTGTVDLGKPILELAPQDVEENERADSLAKVLRYWVELDLENYTNKLAGVCYVQGHSTYTTNEVPSGPRQLYAAFGPESLDGFLKRLGEVATVAGHALVQVEGKAERTRIIAALELARTHLGPLGKRLLESLRSLPET